ncbi:acyltransferase [Hyphomonas oceanitis]|uniref:acyltransferase family protein n=1 Tax=Hyphomonas oceanitis TaxID=81033 RepID=UPI003002C427
MTMPELHSTPARPTLDSVQALRGLAAVMVVFFHAQTAELAPGIWARGYAGVDLFFVISGFILTYVSRDYTRDLPTVARFLYARATRVYPLWWVFALILPLYFLVTYGAPLPPDQSALITNPPAYILKSLLLWPQSEMPVLKVGWTLIHELFFYMIFSLALLFRRSALPVLLIVWAGLTLLGSWLVQGANLESPVLALATSHLTLEFIAGAFVALAVTHRLHIQPRIILLLGLAGLVAALVLYTTPTPRSLLWGRVGVFTLPCCALLYGSVVMEQNRGLRIPGWCVALGNWSYALYLVHTIIILGLQRLSREAGLRLPEGWKTWLVYSEPGIVGNLVFVLAIFALSIPAAALAHIYIERPLLQLTRKVMQRPGAAA